MRKDRSSLQTLGQGDDYATLCKRMTDRALEVLIADLFSKHDAHRTTTYSNASLMTLAPPHGVPQYKRDLFSAARREVLTRKGIFLEPDAVTHGLPAVKQASKRQREAEHHRVRPNVTPPAPSSARIRTTYDTPPRAKLNQWAKPWGAAIESKYETLLRSLRRAVMDTYDDTRVKRIQRLIRLVKQRLEIGTDAPRNSVVLTTD